MSATYPVNEIFYSLQGEGFHAGLPVVFIRFAGCNLKCPFCDTDFSSFRPMAINEIIDEIVKHPAPTVVFTGGEPTLQPLEPLVDALHGQGYKVHIETNGTKEISADIDWVTCSPKIVSENGTSRYDINDTMYKRADELKIVFTGTSQLEETAELFTTRNRFLQPCSLSNTKETVDYILQHPHWRLSLQTHKYIGII